MIMLREKIYKHFKFITYCRLVNTEQCTEMLFVMKYYGGYTGQNLNFTATFVEPQTNE